MTNVFDNILGLIGNTPMVKLNEVTKNIPAKVYAKIESFNPGHSTKDRIALHIIEAAERKGLLTPGATIVETTSGNTGFSIAMVSIIKGYKCILSVSDKTKPEKIAYLKALGATVYVCPASVPADDPRSYYEVAKKIAAETPNSIYINQYFNELNIDAHYSSTGPEIWEQTEGKITHLFACTGTGGTLSGSAKFLKEKNPDIKVIGVDADGSILKTYHETGVIGALAFTFSDTFWFSAVEGEVYSMSSMFIALLVWLITKWENEYHDSDNERWLILIFFITGLSVGVHMMVMLAVPAVCLVYYARNYEFTWKSFIIANLVTLFILAVVFKGIFPIIM